MVYIAKPGPDLSETARDLYTPGENGKEGGITETNMDNAEIFNATAAEYDDITELSYAWYYSRVHWLIARNVIEKRRPETVLDMACGSGFQTWLHGAGGASTAGMDIAGKLLQNAKHKEVRYCRKTGLELFPPRFDFVGKYNRMIAKSLNINGNKPSKVDAPEFFRADIGGAPFKPASFDHVNCVGALSYTDDSEPAISEINRVLKTGGTAFLEVECRWNFQVLWRLANFMLGGWFGEETTPAEIRRFLFTHPYRDVSATFPFCMFGEIRSVRGRYFTFHSIVQILENHGFSVLGKWPILSLTNLVPWTCLDRPSPSNRLKTFFNILATLEEKLPFFFPGVGLAILAEKRSLQ